jgi:hypothetical protein
VDGDTPKVVTLAPPPLPKPPKVRMPTDKDIETILQGEKLEGLILIAVTEEENVGYYRSNLTDHEAVGLIEHAKMLMLGAMDADNFDLED